MSSKSTSTLQHQSYFTCTLGEAQILNQQLEPATYSTINGFLSYLADKYGDNIAIGCASPGIDDTWRVEALSFSELRNAASATIKELLSQWSTECSDETVAIYASSSLSYLVHILACLQPGWKVALISTACSVDAVRHLLKACHVTAVLYDAKHEKSIDQALAVESDSSLVGIKKIILEHKSINRLNGTEIKSGPAVRKILEDASSVVLYGHSSGTSTGLPKPIPITHQDEIGALPRFHQIENYQRPKSTLSTTPIYTGGLADLWRSWSAGTALWTYPEYQVPITAENIMKYKTSVDKWIADHSESASPIGYISCVPYVTQMMAEDSQLLDCLRSMEMVGIGGAAMPISLGDLLVKKGVNLVSRFGSRECGFLLSSNRDYKSDTEWQYLRHDPRVDSIIFRKWNDTDYELIVEDSWPSLSPAVRDKLPFNSHDVFVPHETIKNAWKYNGRSDVQITLTTGKKFDPAGIESALTASEWIKDAVLIGNDRLLPSAILFSSEQAETLGEQESEQKIWHSVTVVNETCPTHARLKKNMIAILPSHESSKIQKSSKGTIMRGKFDELFQDIIQGLYEERAESSSGTSLEALSDDQRIEEISTIVHEHLGATILTADASFYEAGIDSTMSMQIRRSLQSRLPKDLRNQMPLNVVYNTGSIRALVDFVSNLSLKSSQDDVGESSANARQHELSQLLDLVRKDTIQSQDGLRSMATIHQQPASGASSGKVVLLTGATGFLGAHLLAELATDATIHRILCLVRTDSKAGSNRSARNRVAEVLSTYDLSFSETDWAKIRCLYATFHESGLGLNVGDLQHILPRITHIIHAAWAVNFSLPLSAYITQVKGLLNLYNLAKLAGRSGRKAKLSFISSTAVVLSGAQPIAELLSSNPKDASSTGYGKSKWAAEKLLQELAIQNNSPKVDIVRVGQLTASSATGAWNIREAWPLMLDAGFRILGDETRAVLPDLSKIPGKELDWLPVDLAAKSVAEIALQKVDTENASKPAVFHVLSSIPDSPTWKDVQDWLSAPVDIESKGHSRSIVVDFIKPTEWLDLLEAKDQTGVKHLAMSLIPLWRSGWNSDAGLDDRSQFYTERAQEHSNTMKSIATGQQMINRDGFLRMLMWLLCQKQDSVQPTS